MERTLHTRSARPAWRRRGARRPLACGLSDGRAARHHEDFALNQSLYLQPASLDEALAALAARPLAVLAGGTDFYPSRVGQPIRDDILDISRLGALRGISREANGWRLGALTTWAELAAHPLPPLFDGLKLAAREVGGEQIQNTGTLAGNLCNASPAADGIPALLALSAQVELASAQGVRLVPLEQFVLGSRSTARRPDELACAIRVPVDGANARSTFLKLGARRYLVISVVMVAATLEIAEHGQVMRAAVAVGACSPVACRLPALERRLTGLALSPALAQVPRASDLDLLAPVSDVRAPAAYRRDAALTLVRRALRRLGDD
jgi:CO/xanthine dehydrogenase FAD-binding subunit